MSFKDDANLDLNELDKACLEQPRLYAEWSSLWAKSVRERDHLKEQLTAKKMKVDELIRNDPKKYGWEQDKAPTETWIMNRVLQHADVVQLTDELIEMQYQVNDMISAKEMMDHRLKALNILVELYKGGYYSATSKGNVFVKDAVEKSINKQRELINSSPAIVALKKKTLVKKEKSS